MTNGREFDLFMVNIQDEGKVNFVTVTQGGMIMTSYVTFMIETAQAVPLAVDTNRSIRNGPRPPMLRALCARPQQM